MAGFADRAHGLGVEGPILTNRDACRKAPGSVPCLALPGTGKVCEIRRLKALAGTGGTVAQLFDRMAMMIEIATRLIEIPLRLQGSGALWCLTRVVHRYIIRID